jgi:hypothetical protein
LWVAGWGLFFWHRKGDPGALHAFDIAGKTEYRP